MSVSHARYTHGHDATVLKSHTSRTVRNSARYLEPYLRTGTTVLDVGCGPGTITVDIAQRVAPGRVVGIDASADVLAQARTRAATAGVDVEFWRADIYDTAETVRFAAGSADMPGERAVADSSTGYDVAHAHQVLQHVPDPVAALQRMRQWCRPGGVVAARDADYAAMFWYPRLPELDRWLEIYRTVARQNGGEPDAARHLLTWAHAAGFQDVSVTSSVWTYATPDDRAWWGGMWADRIVASAIAPQAIERGVATADELHEISAAWRRWAEHPDGYFAVTHGEILCIA